MGLKRTFQQVVRLAKRPVTTSKENKYIPAGYSILLELRSLNHFKGQRSESNNK